MEWICYSEREEWSDVTPVPQDDGAVPVVAINYSDRFVDVMGYFRHVLLNNELSQRAWEVTEDAIECNPANYTAWAFRRKLLAELSGDLVAEMNHTREMALENPKNYQIWHHRKCLCEMANTGSEEQAFTAKAFEQDSKNYHAWSHRQWAVKHFNLWEGEFDYLDSLIQLDVRNNSAWNMRNFVVNHLPDRAERLKHEIVYTQGVLKAGPFNDSAWGYLRGCCCTPTEGGDQRQQLVEFCDTILHEHPECVQAMDTIVQLAQEDDALRQRGIELCSQLMELDPIRNKYWLYCKDELEACT